MESISPRPAWKTLLAFAIIYFVWGSTFLAIRIGVREVPPLLLAAIRFLGRGLFFLHGRLRAASAYRGGDSGHPPFCSLC